MRSHGTAGAGDNGISRYPAAQGLLPAGPVGDEVNCTAYGASAVRHDYMAGREQDLRFSVVC